MLQPSNLTTQDCETPDPGIVYALCAANRASPNFNLKFLDYHSVSLAKILRSPFSLPPYLSHYQK